MVSNETLVTIINDRFRQSKELCGGRYAEITDLWNDGNAEAICQLYNNPTFPWDGRSDYYLSFMDNKLYLNWE